MIFCLAADLKYYHNKVKVGKSAERCIEKKDAMYDHLSIFY